MSALLLALVAQATAASAVSPDIEITASARVRSVEVRAARGVEGQATAEPGGGTVDIRRSAPAGASAYRNLEIDVRLRAALDPQAPDTAPQNDTPETTGEPDQ